MKYYTLIFSLFLFACSSSKPQDEGNYRAPLLESKILKMKSSYLDVCLAPLSRREYSEKGCAFKLLTSLERSHGISYNNYQLLNKANDLFFSEVESQLLRSLKNKDEISRELKTRFEGKNQAMKYLKEEYAFKDSDLN